MHKLRKNKRPRHKKEIFSILYYTGLKLMLVGSVMLAGIVYSAVYKES